MALGPGARAPGFKSWFSTYYCRTLGQVISFSKTQFLHLVNRDNKYLLHRVVVRIKQYNLGEALAEGLTWGGLGLWARPERLPGRLSPLKEELNGGMRWMGRGGWGEPPGGRGYAYLEKS